MTLLQGTHACMHAVSCSLAAAVDSDRDKPWLALTQCSWPLSVSVADQPSDYHLRLSANALSLVFNSQLMRPVCAACRVPPMSASVYLLVPNDSASPSHLADHRRLRLATVG